MRTDFAAMALAMAATGALAVPVCSAPKNTFVIPVSPKQAQPHNPILDLQRAAHKFGIDNPFLDNCTSALVSVVSSVIASEYAVVTSEYAAITSGLAAVIPTLAIPGYGSVSTSALDASATGTAAVTSALGASATATAGFTSAPFPLSNGTASATGAAFPTGTAPVSTLSTAVSSSSTLSTVITSSSTSSATPSSTPGSSGEVSASPEVNDSEYLAPASIGGQAMTLNLDSGSADLWVFSTKLSQDQISGHAAFDPTKSSTWQDLSGESWQILYGDNSGASGTVGTDNVGLGGITVTRQAVEIATQVSSSFVQDANSDGIIGLAFSSINKVSPNQQKTWFENAKAQLRHPLFTADLAADATGTYEFGTINPAKYTGDITYTNIDKSAGFWQFQSPFTRIGGVTQNCQTCSPTIADTGTSLLLMDDEVVNAFWAKVSGAQNNPSYAGWTYPCDASVPDLEIAIANDFVATIPGAAMNYAVMSSNLCFGSLQSSAGSGKQILGAVFFKQYFTIFDGTDGAERLGLATKSS